MLIQRITKLLSVDVGQLNLFYKNMLSQDLDIRIYSPNDKLKSLFDIFKKIDTTNIINVDRKFIEDITDIVLNGYCGLVMFHKKVKPFILGEDWDKNTFTETIEVDETFKSNQMSAAKRFHSIYVAFPKPGCQHRLHIMKSVATPEDMKFNVYRNTKAHDSSIACLTMSHDGCLIATASEKGMLIRLFNLEGRPLKEVRRSMFFSAKVISMAFSKCYNYLSCSFDSQTVHIFYLNHLESYETIQNYKNNSYYSWLTSPVIEVGKYLTGYKLDTVLCDKADLTFKCESKNPVILAVEVNESFKTIRLIIDEGLFMPTHAYECDLEGTTNSKKLGFNEFFFELNSS